jgi:hypothetical protein
VLVGLVFLYTYTFIEGDGILSQDAGAYFFESELLYNVFWQSPSDYFQLLFGVGDSKALTQQYLLETNHWDVGAQGLSNESRNMIKLHSIIHFVSFKLPEVHMLFMALISTASGYFFYRAIESRIKISKYVSIIVICFLPNILFWSSGLLKESLYLFGFSLIIFALFAEVKFTRHWFAFITGVLLLLLFKFHFLIIVLFGLLVWQISKLFQSNKVLLTATSVVLGSTLILLIFSSFRSKLTESISRKQFDFKNISRGGIHIDTDSCFYFFDESQLNNLSIEGDSALLTSGTKALKLEYAHSGPPDTVMLGSGEGRWKIHFMRPKSNSYFEVTDLNFRFIELLKITPEAISNSLFRPFLSEKGGLWKWVSILEWIFVWTIFLLSFRWIKNVSSSQIEFYLFLGAIMILSALVIGWTTPVSGAIVRYRVPIHLCMILITVLNWNQKTQYND